MKNNSSDYDSSVVHLGKRISIIRKLAGFKRQADFAKKLDVGQTQLCNIERGESAPSYKGIYAILQVDIDGQRISPDWLLTGKEPMLAPASDFEEDFFIKILNVLSKLNQKQKDALITLLES